MTALNDSRVWQDVYRPRIDNAAAYVKLQVVEETTVVISFNFLEDQ